MAEHAAGHRHLLARCFCRTAAPANRIERSAKSTTPRPRGSAIARLRLPLGAAISRDQDDLDLVLRPLGRRVEPPVAGVVLLRRRHPPSTGLVPAIHLDRHESD